MRIFVSHATVDKPFALELVQLPPFIDAWVDSRKLLAGHVLDAAISRAIEDSHAFIVLVSQASLKRTQSNWVAKEVAWALKREAQRGLTSVLPVVIEPDIDLQACRAPFDALAGRLHIDASDRSDAGRGASRERLAQTLFHWLSDWADKVEPKGDVGRRFVARLEADLVEYQKRLHEIKAVMAWPIPALVKDDAITFLIAAKDRYNTFTDVFIPGLTQVEAEIQWRFGSSAHRGFVQLATFIRNAVFHGAAFAMNDVIESVNAYDGVLSRDAEALAEAEARRNSRVDALGPVMADLVRRSSDYLDTLKQ